MFLTNFFDNLGWTRDDLKWICGLVAAIVVALATLSDTAAAALAVPAAALPYIRLGAFIVGIISANYKTSGLPGRAWLLPILLVTGLGLGLSGCVKPPPNLTPQAQVAFTADQIVLKVNELEAAAIAANTDGAIDTATTRVIVEFCVAADTTLKTAPLGWQQTLRTAWAEVKPKLPHTTLVVQITAGVDAAVALLGGAQ